MLVISRDALPDLGTLLQMTPLGEDDAIALLRHFAQPIGNSTSYNLPGHNTLQKVARGCGGFPIAIKVIGSGLRGKPTLFWHQLLKEWSQHGHEGPLALLENSLIVSEDYKRIKEFFKDLGIFPENKRIPVAALVDMWVELHGQDENGSDAMLLTYKIASMNLADTVVQWRIGSDEDIYYDNHFLTQHNILRQLALFSSQQEDVFKRKRLAIDIYGNDRPERWPQQAQQRVAARILSISTNQTVSPEWCNIQAAQAEVLVLNLKTVEYTFPEFIKDMRNLKVIIVIAYGFRRSNVKNLELLGFLQTLKRIRLQRVSVPCLWELKNLHKLSFYMCEVKTAFENNSMNFSNAMPNLVELSIEYCNDLEKLSAGFCDIVNLKKLSINHCAKFTEIPEDIGKLEKLELLRISYCVNFENMPASITKLKSLSFLDISHCLSLSQLPKNIGALENLRNFYMSDCPISDLPESVINLKKLERVICDENAYRPWEVISISKKFELEVMTDKGIILNLPSEDVELTEDEINMGMMRDGILPS